MLGSTNTDGCKNIGLSFEICNTGNIPLSSINWSLAIEGPLIFIGKSQSGSFSELMPGECVTIDSIMVMGIGSINITIQIEDTTKSANGFIIGPFIFLS